MWNLRRILLGVGAAHVVLFATISELTRTPVVEPIREQEDALTLRQNLAAADPSQMPTNSQTHSSRSSDPRVWELPYLHNDGLPVSERVAGIFPETRPRPVTQRARPYGAKKYIARRRQPQKRMMASSRGPSRKVQTPQLDTTAAWADETAYQPMQVMSQSAVYDSQQPRRKTLGAKFKGWMTRVKHKLFD